MKLREQQYTMDAKLKSAAPDEVLEEMLRRIVKGFSPEKAILFGSRAAAAAGPDGDVDLLVVMNYVKSPRHQVVEI